MLEPKPTWRFVSRHWQAVNEGNYDSRGLNWGSYGKLTRPGLTGRCHWAVCMFLWRLQHKTNKTLASVSALPTTKDVALDFTHLAFDEAFLFVRLQSCQFKLVCHIWGGQWTYKGKGKGKGRQGTLNLGGFTVKFEGQRPRCMCKFMYSNHFAGDPKDADHNSLALGQSQAIRARATIGSAFLTLFCNLKL